MKDYSLFFKIISSAIVLVFFIFILESVCQHAEKSMPPLTVDTDGGFAESSRAFLPEANGAMRLNPVKRMSLNSQGFLKQKPSDVYRIVLLGESSVYRLFPFQNLMAEKLSKKFKKKIEILNFGANSYGSTRLMILAKEIVSYSPDLVFVYMGNNEFEELEQFELISPNESAIKNLVFQTAMGRMGTRFLLNTFIEKLRKEKTEEIFSQPPNTFLAWSHHFSKAEVDKQMNHFKDNLQKIVMLFKENKIEVVMSTIPSNYMRPHLSPDSFAEINSFQKLYNEQQYEAAYKTVSEALKKSGFRHQSSEFENSIIKTVATNSHVRFFDFEKFIIEKEPHHIPGETLFMDHCHLNSQGNLFLVDEFVKTI